MLCRTFPNHDCQNLCMNYGPFIVLNFKIILHLIDYQGIYSRQKLSRNEWTEEDSSSIKFPKQKKSVQER